MRKYEKTMYELRPDLYQEDAIRVPFEGGLSLETIPVRDEKSDLFAEITPETKRRVGISPEISMWKL